MKILDIPSVDRPREKLARYGAEKLSSVELIAVILGSGSQGKNVLELSKEILKKFNGTLATSSVDELTDISGLGTTKASQLVAAFELGRRLLQSKKSVLLCEPQSVWEELKDIRSEKKEHFVVFFLDVRNQEIKRETISVGTLTASLVHPREVFEPAVKHLAAQIIVAHNHPSGDPTPSESDREITKKLVDAGKLLGIEVLDHVIVTPEKFLSFKECGYM